MKKYSTILLSTVLFISINIDARIYQISRISNVLKYLVSESKPPNNLSKKLVVFDIDNTLLNPSTDLGSDQWVSYKVKEGLDTGMEMQAAYDKVLPLYFHMCNYIELVPTEKKLVAEVRDIEKNCDHVICLTARSTCLAEKTFEQLDKNNLLFDVPEIDHEKLELPNGSLYQHGVLFCGHNCKGNILSKFLDAINYIPDEIIFVDDKEKNLTAVQGPIEGRNIKFTGLRYTGCDKRVAAFNMDQANKEQKEFLKKHPLNK